MSDGAHQGIGAERALSTILGGEPAPTADEGMSVEAMRAWILGAPAPAGRYDYDEAARRVAKLLLEHLDAHPEDCRLPAQARYVFNVDGGAVKAERDLEDAVKEASPAEFAAVTDGITGFMWGWAMNAARRCSELPPAPNPALLTIEVPDGEAP